MSINSIALSAEDSYALDSIHGQCIHIPSRQIWLHGTPLDLMDVSSAGPEPGVEYMMASKFEKNLELLRLISENDPVIVHLHTCGGMFEEGMAIYDAIKLMPFKVILINRTHARSMSSIILQAADIRFMLPHSHFMFHGGTLGVEGETRTVYSNVDFCREFMDKIMLDIYTEKALQGTKFRSKKIWPEEKLREFIKSQMDKKGDVFLTAKQAISWGFADQILTDWSQIEAAKKTV